MKVKDLIKLLKTYDPNTLVVVPAYNGAESNYRTVQSISLFDSGFSTQTALLARKSGGEAVFLDWIANPWSQEPAPSPKGTQQ